MPIERGQGSLFDASVDALVNAVNTVGVMGKGLALQFKRTFPEVFEDYRRACANGEVEVGRMHLVRRTTDPRFIINFPTKSDWRQPSKLEYIEAGLRDLVRRVRELGIGSIALPALGCGLGGLNWAEVRPTIVEALRELPNVRVVLFEPVADLAAAYASHTAKALQTVHAAPDVVSAGVVNESALAGCTWAPEPFAAFSERSGHGWRESAWYRGTAPSGGGIIFVHRFGNLRFFYLPLRLAVTAWGAEMERPSFDPERALSALRALKAPVFGRYFELSTRTGKTVESVEPNQVFDLTNWQGLAWCVGRPDGLVKRGVLTPEQLQLALGTRSLSTTSSRPSSLRST